MIILNRDEEVKAAILEAAKCVFQKWGLNKTTMEDIAHEAGKGKSTLYYYFKSKDEIFELLVKTELNTIIIKGKTFINQINSSKEKLKKYIATTINGIKSSVSIYSLVKGEIKGDKEFIEKLLKYLDNEEEMIIKEILKGGIISKEFTFLKEKDLSKAANVIVGIIRGLEVYLLFDNDDDEKIDIVTRMISEGI